MKLTAQKQPIVGILVWADRHSVVLYYPDLQGDGEHIVHWEAEHDDNGDATGSWQPLDLGSPQNALRMFPKWEKEERIDLARNVVKNA